MAKSYSKLWDLHRHTKAKHEVLIGYFEAWLPQLGMYNTDLLVVDGFAGPGEYSGREPGSPILLLDAYCDHSARGRIRAKPHFRFIEADPKRVAHLQGLIDANPKYRDLDVKVIHGDFGNEFPRIMNAVREHLGQIPTFAFVDPFGAGDEALHLTTDLVKFPRCEALLYVPVNHLARFIDVPDMEATLDNLFGPLAWREGRKLPTLELKRDFLQRLLQERMEASCKFVRSFDISPDVGGNTYTLFFGTNNEEGLAKMKTSMWKVDPHSGRQFKDTTVANHPVLFSMDPDIGELERLLRNKFGTDAFTIERAKDFVLKETAFRHDGHLKPVLKDLETKGELAALDPKPRRRRGTYPDGTSVRFS